MPQTGTLHNETLTDAGAPLVAGFNPACDPFYAALFAAFGSHGIRNRPLHQRGQVLCGLDVAIHPEDVPQLGQAFAEVGRTGYCMVQAVKLSSARYRMVFARTAESGLQTAVLEIRFDSSKNCADDSRTSAQYPGWLLRIPAIALRPWGGGHRKRGNSAFLVFLGPDGVGKTTLLREISSALIPLFALQEIYRWRPGSLLPTHHPSCLPHSKPPRTFRGSVSYLLFTWVDFVAGHLGKTRRLLQTPALIVFDRYYHDLLVDPKRYRYSGPMWLPRVLERLIPSRDIFFLVLDADEHAIFARKQQLSIGEIRRQRAAYRRFSAARQNSLLIETGRPLEHCREQTLKRLLLYLVERNQHRIPRAFRYSEQFLRELKRATRQPDLQFARVAANNADCNQALDTAI
jgi:thymidylate kinase